MATFANTTSPTPFGAFDDDSQFQSDADKMVTFIKRKLGDDVLSVELTKKQIWANFEESMFEYSNLVNQYQTKSQLNNFLGLSTGSMSGSENKHPRENLEFLSRFAEPYATEAGIGGSYNQVSGSIQLVQDQQDYDIYSELKDGSGAALFTNDTYNSHRSKMRIREVFHYNPTQAYRFFDTTSAVNYLNNEFSFESFTPETIFYVLPVFEDILRAGQLKVSQKVRRSNYSYQIIGTKIRIFPKPTQADPKKMFLRVSFSPDPLNPAYRDDSIYGVSNMSNIPFGTLSYSNINSMAKQWMRQYTLALSKELLGLIRSKFGSVPIPGGDLQLNGADLITQAKSEKEMLVKQLSEMLDSMTYDKIVETDTARAQNINKQLSFIPMPNGKAIIMG